MCQYGAKMKRGAERALSSRERDAKRSGSKMVRTTAQTEVWAQRRRMCNAANGWLPHTTRAALTGLRKRGYTVLLERQDGRPSLYRIAFRHDRKAARSGRLDPKLSQPRSAAAKTRPVESEIRALEQAGVIALRAQWRRLFDC